MKKPVVSVIGSGYVGLCTAVGFASKEFKVLLSDIDTKKIAKIEAGTPPFYEPGLEKLLKKTITNGNLICLSDNTKQAILETDLTFVTVGTPSKPDGSIDLQFIESVSGDIGKAIQQKNEYHVTVIKSTVVPGTTGSIIKPILEKTSKMKCGSDFGLCMNPEFLRQGSAINDTLCADRIVIGEYDKKSGDTLSDLYNKFYKGNLPTLIRTSLSTAELIKYASNSLLATKISFINAMANICEKLPGADVNVVAQAMGLDKRINPLFLNAGLGYGGSCFPKDIKALIACSKNLGYPLHLLEEVENVNKTQPLKAIELCKTFLGNDLKDKQIALLGLAFKPDTDDLREARVIPIINQLLKEGAKITAYDPVAIPNTKKVFKNKIKYATSINNCLKNAECCIIITEWEEFKKLTPKDFIKNMKQPNLIDGRRIFDPKDFKKELKFTAIGLGK